uniref:Uncharacterized protein n=1 Tax=Arundo donax TaxID=35708 RepID=A0A0A9AED5_ARUDO
MPIVSLDPRESSHNIFFLLCTNK